MPYRVRSTDVWFNLPGVVAAYQPVACPGGPLLARQNVGNGARTPGRYAVVAGYPSFVPTFSPLTGWGFDGIVQYFTSGLTHTDTGQLWSLFCRYSGLTNNGMVCGENTGSTVTGIQIAPNYTSNRRLYDNGKYLLVAGSAVTAGVSGIAGATAYYNGVSDGAISTGSLTQADLPILFGRASNLSTGNIQAGLVATRTLSASEARLVSHQMAWCHLNPDWNAWGRRRRYYAPLTVVETPVTADDLTAAAAATGMFGTPRLGRPAMTGHQQAAANATAVKVGHRSRLNG